MSPEFRTNAPVVMKTRGGEVVGEGGRGSVIPRQEGKGSVPSFAAGLTVWESPTKGVRTEPQLDVSSASPNANGEGNGAFDGLPTSSSGGTKKGDAKFSSF